jgi:uncharacterized protein (TIGR00369 family)
VPYAAALGIELADATAGRVRLHLPHRDENGNRNGSLHGGVLASAIAIGGALAAWSQREGARVLEGATVDLAVHYLAPAVRQAVTVEAEVLRRGRALVFADVRVGAGGTIARGLVAYRPGPPTVPVPGPPAGPVLDGVRFRRRQNRSPFTRRLGVEVADLGVGHALAVLPHAPEVGDGHGRVHTGALATLIDCVAGAAAWSIDGFDPHGRAATVSVHLASDGAAADEDVVAEARTSPGGGDLLVNAVALGTRESRRPLGSGTVTYRIVRPTRT